MPKHENRQRSIAQRLSIWLAIQTFVALTAVCAAVYALTNINLEQRQQSLLQQKMEVVQHLVAETVSDGSAERLRHKLDDFFYGRPDFSLRLHIAGTDFLYGKPLPPEGAGKSIPRISFILPVRGPANEPISAELVLDISVDQRMQRFLLWTLLACSFAGAIVVSAMGAWLVKRGLLPLDEVGRQAARLSPEDMGQRLGTDGLDRELRPLVQQFNLLLQRLERAYMQMEGFNSDVAHELRTPLANLIGETELALRTKPAQIEIQDLLGSNLEELQRLAGIINDMLFLSQVDRGAKVRGKWVQSLSTIAQEVADYHEAEALEANVFLSVIGDSGAYIDRTLFQRAVSNLVSNAVRYAHPDTDIEIRIQTKDGLIVVFVRNVGETIDQEHLPRLFHRFFRTDESRKIDDYHHGLGLAIVSAIARMHGGDSFAKSSDRITTIGFELPARSPSECGPFP
ncbi:heavy metal sensor histidine kinase [Achromobacter aloeverae]